MLLNISSISITNDVSKSDKSKDCNDRHPENIWDIVSTVSVFKFDKFILERDSHW